MQIVFDWEFSDVINIKDINNDYLLFQSVLVFMQKQNRIGLVF